MPTENQMLTGDEPPIKRQTSFAWGREMADIPCYAPSTYHANFCSNVGMPNIATYSCPECIAEHNLINELEER